MNKKYFKGFNLIEGDQENWFLEQIKPGGLVFGGTFAEVIIFARLHCNFSLEEIEVGVESMIHKGHNTSHFGTDRRFLFSHTKKLPDIKKAS